jgi:hypothetical protein
MLDIYLVCNLKSNTKWDSVITSNFFYYAIINVAYKTSYPKIFEYDNSGIYFYDKCSIKAILDTFSISNSFFLSFN